MTERVLVVDDEPAVLSVVGRILRQRGYEVLPAASCDEARLLLDACGGALRAVLAGYRLAEGSCGALLAHVRAAFPRLPLVLMSGHGEWYPGVLELDADAILAKPFTAAELVDALARAVVRGAPGDARRRQHPAPEALAFGLDRAWLARRGAC